MSYTTMVNDFYPNKMQMVLWKAVVGELAVAVGVQQVYFEC